MKELATMRISLQASLSEPYSYLLCLNLACLFGVDTILLIVIYPSTKL